MAKQNVKFIHETLTERRHYYLGIIKFYRTKEKHYTKIRFLIFLAVITL